MSPRNGELIKSYRRTRQYSQAALAGLLGVSVSAVSQWERGETAPRPEHVHQLEEVLDAGGALAGAYGLTVPRQGDVVEALTRQVAALREALELRDRLLDGLLERVERLERDS